MRFFLRSVLGASSRHRAKSTVDAVVAQGVFLAGTTHADVVGRKGLRGPKQQRGVEREGAEEEEQAN